MAKQHLDFYTKTINERDGRLPSMGLCEAAGRGYIDLDTLNLFTPTKDDLDALVIERVIPDFGLECFWACGLLNGSGFASRAFIFSPLRQTIVLFMAAINNEL